MKGPCLGYYGMSGSATAWAAAYYYVGMGSCATIIHGRLRYYLISE